MSFGRFRTSTQPQSEHGSSADINVSTILFCNFLQGIIYILVNIDQDQIKLALVNITQQEKHISIEVKITFYFFHANKLHSNAMYSFCENKNMNTIILTLSLHKLPQYIKVDETVIESTQYMSRINEMSLCILKINDFSC